MINIKTGLQDVIQCNSAAFFVTSILAFDPWAAICSENSRKMQQVFLRPLESEACICRSERKGSAEGTERSLLLRWKCSLVNFRPRQKNQLFSLTVFCCTVIVASDNCAGYSTGTPGYVLGL